MRHKDLFQAHADLNRHLTLVLYPQPILYSVSFTTLFQRRYKQACEIFPPPTMSCKGTFFLPPSKSPTCRCIRYNKQQVWSPFKTPCRSFVNASTPSSRTFSRFSNRLARDLNVCVCVCVCACLRLCLYVCVLLCSVPLYGPISGQRHLKRRCWCGALMSVQICTQRCEKIIATGVVASGRFLPSDPQ
jgi:hypothetical protein